MTAALKIVMLEDSATDAEIIQRFLKKLNLPYEFRLTMDKQSFLEALEEFHPDLILSDNSLPQFDATEALRIVRDRMLFIPFILVTGTMPDEFAANIIKSGADDYILKDRLQRLPNAIELAVKRRKDEQEIADYKYALDQSSIISITDQKGIIKYANENFCKISKYTPDELIGQDHRIINSGFHPKSYIKNLWTTIANGNIWRGEFRNKAKDGTLYWVDATIVPFLNKKGKPYQYLAIRTDITDLKKTEEALKTARDRVFFHIDNSPLAFIEWGKEITPKSWSKRAEEIFGWTEKEATSGQLDWFSKVYEEDRPWVKRIADDLVSGKIEKTQVQHRNYTGMAR